MCCVAHSVIGVLFMCYGNVIEVFLLMCVLCVRYLGRASFCVAFCVCWVLCYA